MSRVCVLISGRGSNFQALIDAQKRGELDCEIVIVISDKPDARGLERAEKAGIPTRVVTKSEYPKRQEHDAKVLEIIDGYDVDLVVLAGYMRVLSEDLVNAFKNRIINIHPSLLPSFRGVNAQQQALDYGVRFSGCTTHFVENEVDGGPVILQSVVPVHDNDTRDSLAERILENEHEILVRSVQLFCQDRLRVEGRHVRILDE